MSEGTCIRCGQRTNVEYGPDGQAYCTSCIFYGMNKPCWKCRMYLPASELQQYRGQWTCQYCMMDLRDAERRAEEGGRAEQARKPERCERCGRESSMIYFVNGRRLCEICYHDEQGRWKDGTLKPPRSRMSSGGNVVVRMIRVVEDGISDFLSFGKRSKVVPVPEGDARKEAIKQRAEDAEGSARKKAEAEKAKERSSRLMSFQEEKGKGEEPGPKKKDDDEDEGYGRLDGVPAHMVPVKSDGKLVSKKKKGGKGK